MTIVIRHCPVCGFTRDNEMAFDGDEGFYIGVICPCCGNEYDVTDDLEAEFLMEWFENGIISSAEQILLMKPPAEGIIEKELAYTLLRLKWISDGEKWWSKSKAALTTWSKEKAAEQLLNIGVVYTDYVAVLKQNGVDVVG